MFESAVSPRRINRDRSAVSLASRLPIKIFQIGFNKCGTRTIHRYLARNGVRSLHWDAGRLAKRMYANLAEGRELLAGYEEFDAFTDMEYLDEFGTTYLEGYKLYPHLAAQYPNAVFILNTSGRPPRAQGHPQEPQGSSRQAFATLIAASAARPKHREPMMSLGSRSSYDSGQRVSPKREGRK